MLTMEDMLEIVKPHNDKLIAEGRLQEAERKIEQLEAALAAERARCVAIVQAARFGEVSQDFRAVVSMIESGESVESLKAQ